MVYCSDFETVNNPDDCRVWAWLSLSLDLSTEHRGKDIDTFLRWIDTLHSGDVVYFHNLKFDGEFIVHRLLTTGHQLHIGRGKIPKNSFTCVIGDMGQWYNITIRTTKGALVSIQDSLKIWNFSIKELAKSFKMDISKGEIDYNAYRAPGYEPTPEEWDYIYKDVAIAAKAMSVMIQDGYTKMTAGSNALWSYKMIVGKNFEYWFPQLDYEVDAFIRKSYRGGWCYVSELVKGKDVGEGIVLDVNSLYPSRMYDDLMPYGNPRYVEGKCEPNELYSLYVQRILVDLRLKPGYLPTLQLKHNPRFGSTEYIKSTGGDPLELTLTSVDLELMFEHYDILSIEYLDGFMLHGIKGCFNTYIDTWMQKKEKASEEGDTPKRNQAKLFMNSLYGKFATRPEGQSKYPYLGDDNILHLKLGEKEDRQSLYIPVGTFITSYARAYTIRSAQAVYPRFCYADTDSLHLTGTEIPDGIEVHKSKLGAWKHESTFRSARYIGPKCYAENIYVSRETLDDYLSENPGCTYQCDYDNMTLLSVTCAGMPDRSKKTVTFDDFRVGLVVNNKLVPKHVPGGIVLTETTFAVKER